MNGGNEKSNETNIYSTKKIFRYLKNWSNLAGKILRDQVDRIVKTDQQKN